MAVIVNSGVNVPLNITSSPKQLADANVQSTIINPAVDAAGNPAKLSFFGVAPVTQPIPVGNTNTPAAGSGTQVFTNTTFDGGTGTSAYTIGDIVAALKELNLAQISPGTFVAPSAPVLTGNPSISGPNSPPLIADVLTATHGTYSGTVSGYSGQWYSGAVAVPGATALTYTVLSADAGKSIVYAEDAFNLGGSSAIGTSNSLGPVSAAGISAPTYALHTASGVTPASWDVTGDSTFQPGMWVHQEFATNSGFTTGLADYYTEVQGSDWEATSANIGGAASVGISGASQVFVQPTGTYYTRCRFETVPGDTTNNTVSPWSNTVTDTISASTAAFASSGTTKSPYITLANANLSWIDNNTVGQLCAVLASIASINTKWHTEVSIDGWGSGGTWYCGISDGALNFSSPGFEGNPPASNYPGDTAPGLSVTIGSGGTGFTVWANSSTTVFTLPNSWTASAGDRLIWEVDQSAKTINWYWYHSATTTLSGLIGTTTLSSAPSSWNLFGGGTKGTGTAATSDSGTWYPASANWKMTPSTGYNFIYG